MESPLLQALLLGLIQGLTEFLPVSSSGHLAIAQRLLPGFEQPGVLLDVLLHFGTFIAVLAYFRRDLYEIALVLLGRQSRLKSHHKSADSLPAPGFRLIAGIVIATIPTGIIGLALESRIEAYFDSVRLVGFMLLITSGLLFFAEYWTGREAAAGVEEAGEDPDYWRSVVIGVAQGLAIFPGISRSGATITTGMLVGLKGEIAARFSFLISLPVIFLATAYELFKHRDALKAFNTDQLAGYIGGPFVAAVVGYACIAVVMWVVKGKRLKFFGAYCCVVGLSAIIFG